MPNLVANTATYRAGRYQSRTFLSYLPRTVITSRSVNQSSFTYTLKSVVLGNAYSSSTSTADIKEGMTFLVYNANTNTLKGIGRVAYGGFSGSTLQINEMAQGVIDWANLDRVDVVAAWNIFDVLVAANATFDKDSRRVYSDEGSNPPPVCVSGGPIAGFVDAVSGLLSVNFYGSGSYRIDPDAGSITTHAWVFPGATPATSSSADPTGVTFPAASVPYLCSHAITDSNGKSVTQYVPVWAYNRSTIQPLTIQNLTVVKGLSAEFEAAESAMASIPDKSFVLIWEEEAYAGAANSYGSNVTGRSSVKFVGYLNTEDIKITADDIGINSTVTFQAISPLGILNQTAALPQLMISSTSPTKWTQLKSLTVWRSLWYLLTWGSSFTNLHDFLWPSSGDLAYARLAVQNINSIGGQLKDVADSINVDVTCDALGRLLLVQNPNYLSLTNRATVTTTYNFTTADIRELELPRNHWRPVKFVRGSGILSSATIATQAVFSNAPGNAPSEGVGSEQFARKIISSQSEMNRLTGEHFAALNALWYDESTKAISAVPKGATMLLPDGYDWLDPAYREWITLTLPASSNLRGASYSTATRWLIQTVTVRYGDDGGKEVEVTLDHETHGPAAVTYVPPTKADTGTPVVTPPGISFPGSGTYTPPVSGPSGWLPGAQTIALFTTNGILWRTSNFNTPSANGGPTWTSFSYTPGGVTFRSFVVDAASPKYVSGSGAVNGWLRTDNAVYRITDIFGTPVLALQLTIVAGSQNWGIDFSYGAGGAGLWGVTVCRSGNKVEYNYTTNGGSSWSAVANLTANDNTGQNRDTGLFISANTGIAYASGINGSGNSDIYKMDYSGLTWSSHLAVGSTASIGALVVPFFGGADTYLYYSRRNSSSTTNGEQLMRYDGSSQTDISPVVAGTNYVPLVNESLAQSSRWKLTMPSNSDTKLLMIAQSANGTGPSAIFATSNLKDATPVWTTVLAPGTSSYSFGALADDGQSAYFWGGDTNNVPLVGYSGNVFDGSGIVDSRLGNIVNCNPIGICGG